MKNRFSLHNRFFLVCTAVVMLCIVQIVSAQMTGRIVGTVVDAETNEVLPGANIMIPGTVLGAASDTDGYYSILSVPPGIYSVQATMMGYGKVTKTQVQVSVDRNTALNFELSSEIIEGQEVTIVAERDILHTEVSNSQQVILAGEITESAGIRTINQFLGAQAGIDNARHLTVRGGSADQTGAIVNGISFGNPRIGLAEATVPLSAVEQVSLQAGGFSAEFGNFRSGILNVTTKSGKDKYHGTATYTRNQAHMKRFGKSLYDPTNFELLPMMDPVVSFVGTKEGFPLLYSDPDELDYVTQQYTQFTGWNTTADRYNKGIDPADQVTPMDLYLWSAWSHQAVPDFDALAAAHPEYVITEEQKKALREHAHEPEGSNPDWDMDFGFGGPVPFVSKMLGDATFYVSNKTTNTNYIQPVYRDGEYSSVTMGTIKSNLTNQMTLKLNGIYRIIHGSQQRMPSNGDIPDLENGGNTMDENNIYNVRYMGPEYYWSPTFWQAKDQKTFVGGFTLNNVINPETFWDLTVSYAHHVDKFDPEDNRDKTAITHFGPLWVSEAPYGISTVPDTVYNPDDPTQYTAYNIFSIPSGISISRRFSGKNGEFHENSTTDQLRAKFDLSKQFNRYNFVKSGIELNYYNIKNDNWRWWKGYDTLYELRDQRKPWSLGAYIQDQLSLEGMEARFGLRFDYYNSGGGVWPTGDMYNTEAFTRGTEGDNLDELYTRLMSGENVIWSRWNAIDEANGGALLEKTKNYFMISPRLGVAFPVTERSKFFFNYGHFRSPVPYSQLFMYTMRFFKTGLTRMGNPNLEPPRTISYELGVAYNLANDYLIETSAYYKDISGEAAAVQYNSSDGTVSYSSYLNNRWENDLGFEVRVSKSYGKYLSGWVNFWYVIDKNGRVGRRTVYEDEVRNNEVASLYAGDEIQPQLSPRASANITLRTPAEFGPRMAGQHLLGDWMLSVLPSWRRGSQFTYNPASIRNLQNNLRWPDYYMVDMKLSKAIQIAGVTASVYLDVKNVFNFKVNWMSQEWCFAGANVQTNAVGQSSIDGTDATNYLNSLHLPMYSEPEYVALRASSTHSDWYIPGDDKVGDLRSDDKPYINDPNNALWIFGLPRNIWFGISFNF